MSIIRLQRHRRAFSLIEILVAILLIGILMAVALPRLLGSREAAGDSNAQQQLNTAVTAAATVFTGRESYSTADAAGLQDDVKEIPLTDEAAALAPDSNAREVSIAVSNNGNTWTATALGGEGRCWIVELNSTEADRYGRSDGPNTACDASTVVVSQWSDYGFPAAE